ncbi:MAG: PD-(D/E)XK nuclease family protein [Planctomycetaceae bacterium]
MSRRLLLGRAGAGKTHACLDLLEPALAFERKACLLVPTLDQAEHVRSLLLDRRGGLRARVVETFSSLAEELTGLRLGALAHPGECDRVAADALAPQFPDAALRPGFRAEFLASVKEIKETGAPLEEALAHARAYFPEGSREHRLFLCIARYVSLLPRPDHEDLLGRARDRLAQRGYPLDLLLVDGFHDFTGIELQILQRLAAGAGETVLTLPMDAERPASPVFASSARTAAHFPGFARESLSHNYRARTPALRHAEAALAGAPAGKPPAPLEGIELLACASEEDEADRLARLVVASRRPFADFLIVRRSFSGLHATYRAAFRRHGVPLRFFGGEPLLPSAAGRAALLLLRAAAGEIQEAELPALLRSPFLLDAPPRKELDAIAARLRAEGSVADWSPFPDTAARREALRKRAGSVAAFLDRHLGLRDALAAAPDGAEDLARAGRLMLALRREAEALAGLPFEEAARRLIVRLPLLTAGGGDRRHDCVYAVEALDARQWQKPVVFACGLSSASFPRPVRQDLFLRDAERAGFAAERGVRLPLRALREEEERYLFYVVLTRARERLVLSWAAFDEEGTPQPASPYLEEAVSRLPGIPARAVPLAEQYVQERDAIARRDLLPLVADGLGRLASGRARAEEAALAAALHDLGCVDRGALAYPRRLELARLRPIGALPRHPAERLSASGINDFLRCPYLFLARRVHRVEPPRKAGLDPALRGEILHRALERFVKEGRPAHPGLLFDAIWAESTGPFRLLLGDEAARRWMRACFLRAAESLRAAPVESVEREFAVAVGEVTLRGRIDRIDRLAAGALIRDYKSGTVDLKETLAGRDAQLDVYLLALPDPAGALFERLRTGDATGLLLASAGGEVEGEFVLLTPEEMEARRERTRALVRRIAAAAAAGRLAVDPADPESCTRGECDGYDLCRVHRARIFARRAREQTP